MTAPLSTRLLAITLATGSLLAQNPTPKDPVEAPQFVPEASLASWVARQKIDEDGAAKLARQLVDHEKGLRTLGNWLRRTRPEQTTRLARLDELSIRAVFACFDVEAPKGFVYAGQYDRLRVLQPRLGPTLAGYVVDPPDWLPGAQRIALVEVLRDLYVAPPQPEIVDTFERLAIDDREADVLTESVAFAAYQWGRRGPAEARLAKMRELAGEVRKADDLVHQKRLAKALWRLRDYRRASESWQLFLERTVDAGLRVRAIDQYDAACSYSLAGRVKDALEQIRLSTTQIVEKTTDLGNAPTQRMFEKDPDLRAVRKLPEYAKLIERAFPDDGDGIERP